MRTEIQNLVLGVESNWNSLEICSIQFENLRFDWFERAKSIQKIRWKLIWNLFDSIRLKLYVGWSQIFQMLDLFEIRSIRLENLWFDWFERWKIFRKNSIKINSKFVRFDSTPPLHCLSDICPNIFFSFVCSAIELLQISTNEKWFIKILVSWKSLQYFLGKVAISVIESSVINN